MKVTPPNHPATTAAKSHRKTAAPESDKRFTVTADTSQAPEEPPVAAKNTAAHAGKAVPPGLAKVQARLQALAASNPERSQGNALSAINRNVARYAEQQAVAVVVTTPEIPPPASTPSEGPDTPEASTSTTVSATPEATESPETVTATTTPSDTASGTAT